MQGTDRQDFRLRLGADPSDPALAREAMALGDGAQDELRRALAPGGRIAIQCGGAADWNRGHRERVLAALRAGFATVEVERVVIPSFNEGGWVFAGAC